MKKFAKTALALVTSMVVSASVPVFADTTSDFTDISDKKYSWAVEYINEMSEKGFIKGYEDGTFRPDNSITRLEALSLFSRAMRSEANEAALDAAILEYGELLSGLKLNFGENDIAYLLYRGALKESELQTYLAEDVRNEPMPRYEAATIITKALCAEKEASKEIMIVLDYTDAKKIPTNSTAFVSYVTEKGIMSGMGDGTFSPLTGVLRSQMAVMLSKTVDAMGLTVEELKITSIDDNNIYFYDSTMAPETEEPQAMGYTDNTRFYMEGDPIQPENIPNNIYATFTYVQNEVAYVDIINAEPDREVSGVYQASSRNNGVYVVSVKNEEGEIESFEVAEDAEIIYANKEATIRDFTDGAKVKVWISGGKLVKIKGESKTSEINKATIEEISIVEDGTITISHALDNYNGLSLEVSPNVKVVKNDVTSSMLDIYRGDVVNLTLEYGVVTKIVAESVKRVYEGTIKSIEISSAPKITVNVKGTDNTYDVTADVEILVNNKEGSLYDFRVGDTVTITLESKAVVKIVATSSVGVAYNRQGVVSAVNDSYKFIKIAYTEGDVTYEENVYCKDNTTKFITSDGTTKALKDLNVGDVVSVRGTSKNGAFEASLVIIELD